MWSVNVFNSKLYLNFEWPPSSRDLSVCLAGVAQPAQLSAVKPLLAFGIWTPVMAEEKQKVTFIMKHVAVQSQGGRGLTVRC